MFIISEVRAISKPSPLAKRAGGIPNEDGKELNCRNFHASSAPLTIMVVRGSCEDTDSISGFLAHSIGRDTRQNLGLTPSCGYPLRLVSRQGS